MRRVLKHVLQRGPGVTAVLRGPERTRVVLAGVQHNSKFLWTEQEDDGLPDMEHRFRIYATGEEIPIGWVHVYSFQDGPYVWHVYKDMTNARSAN